MTGHDCVMKGGLVTDHDCVIKGGLVTDHDCVMTVNEITIVCLFICIFSRTIKLLQFFNGTI